MLCDLFRAEFAKSYSKYTQPQVNASGVKDKAGVVRRFQERTVELQREHSRAQLGTEDSVVGLKREDSTLEPGMTVSEIMDAEEQDETTETQEINLANQLVGETQVFIHTMRVVLYEFYGIRALKQEGLLQHQDFDNLEDDIFFIIQKLTIKDSVLTIMVVLSRIMNNKADKEFREKCRLIEKF